MHHFIPWLSNRKLNLVQIQTTSVCNAECVMCPYRTSWHRNNPGYMKEQLYQKILRDIDEYDPDFSGKICLYLENEPFADSKILERIETAYNILNKPYIELSSNMSLLTPDKIDNLYQLWERHNFYGKFTISHHGVDKESFEDIMKIPYEEARENMIYFLKKFQGKIKISIQNMSFSLDHKFQLNQYRKVKRYLSKLLKEHGIDEKYIITDPKIFHNRAGNVKISGWNYDRIIRKIGRENPFDCLRIHGCLHVLYTGEVILCCMDYNRETVINDLRQITVEDHFESASWRHYYNMVVGKEESPNDFICKRCMSPGG